MNTNFNVHRKKKRNAGKIGFEQVVDRLFYFLILIFSLHDNRKLHFNDQSTFNMCLCVCECVNVI